MHYVIGDVHGCYTEMKLLLDKIESNDPDATIIFVGDFIDRGPEVWKVLTWMMEHVTPEGQYQSVRGNHEDMILKWYKEWKIWWSESGFSQQNSLMPETEYDFSKWLDGMNYLSPEKLEPIMDFLRRCDIIRQFQSEQSQEMKSSTVSYMHGCSRQIRSPKKIRNIIICGWESMGEIWTRMRSSYMGIPRQSLWISGMIFLMPRE